MLASIISVTSKVLLAAIFPHAVVDSRPLARLSKPPLFSGV